MYRIRSASGTEAVYNSLEEFNVAVRRGAVSPDDEIFHMRANRWLDVKSHPHYRLAISGAGHNDVTTAKAPSAPLPQPAPRPVASPAPAPQASPVRASAPPAERPAVRPAQTVLRPQLVADAGPVAPSPSPTAKSKDLAFIDLGTPSQRNATVIEARKAPAPAPAPAAPKAEPKRAAPETEVEFLVMDGGIESPVRTSRGHKTIPEDLDLLFDTPMPSTKPAVTTAPKVSTAAPEQAPKAQVQITPRDPVKPAEAPAARTVAAKVIPLKPAAATVETPVVAAPRPAAPTVEAPVVAVPKPAAPVAAPKVTAPVATVAAAAPAAPAAVPAPAPVPAAVVAPPVAAPERNAAPSEDLSIPGAALLEAPVPMPVEHAPVPAVSGTSRFPMIAAGIALVVLVGGALAWKPWAGHAAPTDVALQTSGAVPGGQQAQTAVSAPVTTPAAPASGSAPAPGKPVVAPQGPQAATAKQDSVSEKPAEEEIIAAARPTFTGAAGVPAGDLGLGSDIQPGETRAAAVAPSVLVDRLETAEKLAQLELGTKLGGFRALFTPSRLSSSTGVAASRSAWTNGADAIRQYRAKVARLEQAYEDSVLSSQRSQRWSSEQMRAWAIHQSQAEPVETSQLADLMFSQVSEGLDILAALDGQYTVKGSTIAFKNPSSGTRYTSIRTWVEQRTGAWAGTPESARPYSVSAILRALGDGLPAAE